MLARYRDEQRAKARWAGTGRSRKDQPDGGYRAVAGWSTLSPMLWIVLVIAVCPVLSLAAERAMAVIPVERPR